jgi:hypothetical protein
MTVLHHEQEKSIVSPLRHLDPRESAALVSDLENDPDGYVNAPTIAGPSGSQDLRKRKVPDTQSPRQCFIVFEQNSGSLW